MLNRPGLCLASLILCLAGRASGDFTYRYDDGVSNIRLGPPSSFAGLEVDMMFGNMFETDPGGEFITQLQIEIGRLTPGTPATIGIWNDPNNDNVPDDLELLHAFDAFPTDTTFGGGNLYDIAPVQVTGSFFVGVIIDVEPVADAPARLDPDARADRSWLLYGPSMDVDDPWGSSKFQTRMDDPAFVPIFGAFAVRAVGSDVPGPGGAVLFCVALLAGGRRYGRS